MITSIKRVVSSFLLSRNHEQNNEIIIAVFHRVDTMPTFPSHWAACSGSIEEIDKTPWETARRELHEETNVPESVIPNKPGGLYLDVQFRKTGERETIIRVYPFTVDLPPNWKLELKGTEHDTYKYVTIHELEQLQPTVPGLAQAFHHATNGQYLEKVPKDAKEWALDKSNGAAIMARNAIHLVNNGIVTDPNTLKMMRPSMVAITNALDNLKTMSANEVLESLQTESMKSVNYAVQYIEGIIKEKLRIVAENNNNNKKIIIATHSRSSTAVQVLKKLVQLFSNIEIICGKSIPGDEGILMANDLHDEGAICIEDDDLLERIRHGMVDILLTGCDCITELDVVNKVGTTILAQTASGSDEKNTIVLCCVDRYKIWNDIYPPPLEDIFESTPKHLFHNILLPPQSSSSSSDTSTTNTPIMNDDNNNNKQCPS